MRTRFVLGVGVLVGLVAGSAPGSTRFLDHWPYDKLMKESDLVVIATAVKTEDAGDAPPKHSWPAELVGQNTTFEVKHALKGKAPDKQIKVLHFKFGDLKKERNLDEILDALIFNGPLLVAFPSKNAPEHLLFLKALKDGRYEPVSGRIDPRLSVRRLSDPECEIKNEK